MIHQFPIIKIIILYLISVIFALLFLQYGTKKQILDYYSNNINKFIKTISYTFIVCLFIGLIYFNIFPAYAGTYRNEDLDDDNNSNLILYDKSAIFTENRLIVYENDKFYGIFNYSEIIPIKDNRDYIIIMKQDIIEYTQSSDFFYNFLDNYGYTILTISIIALVIGIWILFVKRGKK